MFLSDYRLFVFACVHPPSSPFIDVYKQKAIYISTYEKKTNRGHRYFNDEPII